MSAIPVKYVLVVKLRKSGVGAHHEIMALTADQLPDGVGFNTRAELKAYLKTDNITRPRIENQ